MKKYLLIIQFLVITNMFSQEVPVNKYDTSISYLTFKNKLVNGKTNLFGFNYNKTNYLNSFYGTEVENGNIKYQFGVSLYYRKRVAKQFIIDAEVFYNLLKSHELTISNYGGDISFGIVLIPFSLKLTTVLQPYLSIGYQQSLMNIEGSTSDALVKDYKEKTTDTSAPIWKAGMMIHISKSIFFNAQYMQSLSSKNDRDFNSWSAGIGIKY